MPRVSLVLRLSYTNTIARPKYYDLVPHVSISRKDDEVSLGNQELKATLSHNVDFSAEYFFPAFGMISAGAYYKKINDFIVDQRWLDADYEGTRYGKVVKPVNGGKADLFGVELSWQRDFGFIAPALRHFGLYANYTYTHSRITDFRFERENSEGNMLKNKNLPMPGTPEHIANVSLYFERKGLNVRFSYNFAGDFIDEFGAIPFDDRYYDRVNYMDLNASYTFSKHYTVFAEANNLLNQPLRHYKGNKDSSRILRPETECWI